MEMPRFDALELKVVSRDEQREEQRRKLPKCAKIIDEFRAVFGDVFVLRSEEGGQVSQSKRWRPDSDYGCLTADEYLALGKRYREDMARRMESERKRNGR